MKTREKVDHPQPSSRETSHNVDRARAVDAINMDYPRHHHHNKHCQDHYHVQE